MTQSRSSEIRTFTKLAIASMLVAAPLATGSLPSVLAAPPPADPPTDGPAPPSRPHGEYYNPNDPNDWWNYGVGDTCGGGGG